jgi:hypothetical protein
MKLAFNLHDTEPYDLDLYDISDVIEREADNVLSEANADHLEDPSDESYDRLRASVILDATAMLTDGHGNPRAGATYRDPIGVVWAVIDDE